MKTDLLLSKEVCIGLERVKLEQVETYCEPVGLVLSWMGRSIAVMDYATHSIKYVEIDSVVEKCLKTKGKESIDFAKARSDLLTACKTYDYDPEDCTRNLYDLWCAQYYDFNRSF